MSVQQRTSAQFDSVRQMHIVSTYKLRDLGIPTFLSYVIQLGGRDVRPAAALPDSTAAGAASGGLETVVSAALMCTANGGMGPTSWTRPFDTVVWVTESTCCCSIRTHGEAIKREGESVEGAEGLT